MSSLGFDQLAETYEKIKAITEQLANLLFSGGHEMAGVMNRSYLCESMYVISVVFIIKACRRPGVDGQPLLLGYHSSALPWRYSLLTFYKIFSEDFKERDIYPIRFFVPPSYLSGIRKYYPDLTQKLYWLEEKIQFSRLASLASDHY